MNRTAPVLGLCLTLTFGLLLLGLTGPTHAKVLHEERSVYTRIIVEDSNRLRCLKFTLKREDSTQTCINLNYPKRMVFSYTQMSMASLLLNPNPASVLIVGLGGGTLPMALRDLLPEARVDTVEIDEAVVRVAKEYFGYREDEYNRAIIQDARVYGKRSALRGLTYDLIILDAFNGEYIPEHLMTVEFLEEMRALLSDDGVLVANTFASSQLYDFESATYAAVFGDFLNFRGSSTGNRVILVPQAKLPADQRDALDTRTLRARAAALQDGLKPYGVPITRYAGTLAALSKKKPDWDADTRPLTDQFSPANVLSQ
ncbi:MAG: fused MFS/spermidine synthase [Pseudomonadales bacterium]|jgi:spermidine synthase|nr:fused MFS/spermidine synthase [Pseudomonadales bacterium]